MPAVVWTEEAVLDTDELEAFLYRNNPDAAVRAVMAIFDAADQLERFPQRGRPAEGRTGERELLVPFGTGGYLVLYRVDDDVVVILATKHMREAGY